MEISQTLAAQAEVAFAKSEIHDLIVAQCRAVDRADEALLRSLWHAGATVDLGALFAGSSDDFCAWMLGVVRSAAYSTSAISLISRTWSVGEGVCSASGDAPTSKVCKPARRPASTSVGASPTNHEPARSTA